MSATLYLSVKSLHVIAIISWMAGILYLFRLFVYHFEFGRTDQSNRTLLSLMEVRLLRYITFPAMIVAALSGATLVFLNPALLSAHWFHLKLFLAVSLILVTLFSKRLMLDFQRDHYGAYTSKRLRFLNEVPTLLMIGIVILVILRPF